MFHSRAYSDILHTDPGSARKQRSVATTRWLAAALAALLLPVAAGAARFVPSALEIEVSRIGEAALAGADDELTIARAAVRTAYAEPCRDCTATGLYLVDLDASGDASAADALPDDGSFGFALDLAGRLPVRDVEFPCATSFGRAQWTLSTHDGRGVRSRISGAAAGCSDGAVPIDAATYLWGSVASVCRRQGKVEMVLDAAPAAAAYGLAGVELTQAGYRLAYDPASGRGTLEPLPAGALPHCAPEADPGLALDPPSAPGRPVPAGLVTATLTPRLGAARWRSPRPALAHDPSPTVPTPFRVGSTVLMLGLLAGAVALLRRPVA